MIIDMIMIMKQIGSFWNRKKKVRIETNKEKNRSSHQTRRRKKNGFYKIQIEIDNWNGEIRKKRKKMIGMDEWFTWRWYEKRKKKRVKLGFSLLIG